MLLFLLLLPDLLVAQNLFKNPGFESLDGWSCSGCNCSLSTDSHGGSYSYKITTRKRNWAGIAQEITVQPGQSYFFKVFVKLLNTANGRQYHHAQPMIDIIDTSGNHMYDIIGKSDYTYPGQWYALGGDYNIPTNATSVRFYVQIPQEGVDYLADDAELTLIPSVSVFSTDVDKQIDKLRKADLSISLEGSNPSNLEIEVQQTRSEFGWGSAVNVHYLSNSKYINYRKFYYDLFEWGVLENALKWQYLEKTQGSFKPDAALGAVNDLLSNGIKVRGHNIFWGAGKYVPVWQKSLSPLGMKQSLEQHIKDMTSTFRGKFQQWDVNNENVHLKFYEERLKDPNITAWMIREVHRMDPITECYLNDYGVVANKYETMAYVNQAVHLKESGVPVVGMGIQSHLHNLIDVSIIKARLDALAKAGLDIWITELDIDEADETRKTQKYEEVLRVYFSHPAVKGVMFWGFWDGRHWNPAAALTNGPNVTPNAAGRRVQELLKHTWRTNESHSIAHGQSIKIRGFLGSYKLLVRHAGQVIHTEDFNLGKGGNSLKINIKGLDTHPQVDHVIIG